jgi:hypothetical protein
MSRSQNKNTKITMAATAVLMAGLYFCCAVGSPAGMGTNSIRAVSLRVLQSQIQASKGALPQPLAELGGLQTIWGYIADEESKDIILYGEMKPGSTNSLKTEDLVIALRNAWMKYARLEGNTYTYSDPGCSIDPDAGTMERLTQIGQTVNSNKNNSQVHKQLEAWQQICREWQEVRVLGIPFDTGFSTQMVTADYDMKVLVDGSDTLDVPGFSSLTGMKLNIIRNAVLSGQQISVSPSGMNRFWFHPGPNQYEEDDGIVWIKHCPVVLLTEEMSVARNAASYGSSGGIDPLAQRFSKDFSNLYSKVAEARPIYSRLEGLFRFVALAKILHFREMAEIPGLNLDPVLKPGLDLSFLLNKFPVQSISVAKQLQGRSAIKEFKHTSASGNSQTTYQLWLQSCGGVGININVNAADFIGPSPFLRRIRRSILAARRATPNALYWDLPNGDVVSEVQNSARLTRLNSRKKWRTAVRIDYKDSKYHLSTEAGRLYEGETISGLMIALRACGAVNGQHLTVETSGFLSKELPAFRAALRLQIEKYDPELALVFVTGESKESELFEALVSPGTALDPPSQMEKADLRQTKTQTASLRFLVRGMSRNHICNVEITSEKAEYTREMVNAILERIRPYDSTSESLFDCVIREKPKVLKKLKLQNKNIQIRIRSEDGFIETGAILFKARSQTA